MLSPEDIQSIGQLPSSERRKFQLAPGDDVPESPWKNLVNLRLKVEGNYIFWKTRGGSTLVHSFFGNILTVHPIQAEISGVITEFLAVHTSAGKVYLWNISAETSDEIVSSGFSTTTQIQFANIGRFLYMFDYDGGKSSYYDLTKENLFDYLSYDKSYISEVNWLSPGLTEQKQNIFDFEVGNQIIVFPDHVADSGTTIFDTTTSPATTFTLNPNEYTENSFLYTYNTGKYLTDEAGNEYKKTQFITFRDGADPLTFTVEGSGAEVSIARYYIPLSESGDPDFNSYVTKIESIADTGDDSFTIKFKDPVGIELSFNFGGVSDDDVADKMVVLPYNPDMEPLVGVSSRFTLSSDNSEVVQNENYRVPSAYRQYVIFDLLNDGSVTLMGKPYQLEASKETILVTGGSKVNFTITSPSSNVEKRFLATTRWQPSAAAAFTPTSEEYENSPLFIIGEINKDRSFVRDQTPDSKLFRGIGELQDLIAGVMNIFDSDSLKPNNVAQFTGSLLVSGYTVNRPVPVPYTNAATATNENVFIDFESTSQLANNMAVAFMFEYPDGRRSEIVETEEFLQEGDTITTTPVACDQEKASGGHEITTGAQEDGDVDISYDGITVRVPLTTAAHANPDDAAEAIRQALVASDIRVATTVPSGANLLYTEKRFGEEFNGNEVVAAPVPIAATASIDVTGNNLVVAPSEGWIDVTANTLPGSGSENHTIDVGANSTNPITINDTDTLEDVVDKYVSELNGTAAISADWTASKVDNGDGTWRCLISSDSNDESFNGTVIAVSGDVDVTVSVETPTSGGNDGDESHEITVDGETTSPFTVSAADSPEDVVDKYVSAANGEAGIFTSWTASKVDLGGGDWRCLLTNDTPGAAGNGKVVSVSVTGTSTGSTQVDLTTDSPSSGGSDGVGLVFDDSSPELTGAQEPVGTAAKGFIIITGNILNPGEEADIQFVVSDSDDPFDNLSFSDAHTVNGNDSLAAIASELSVAMNTTPAISGDWTASQKTIIVDDVPRDGIEFEANDPGVEWNDKYFRIEQPGNLAINYEVSAPGRIWTSGDSLTNGGDEGCLQAEASLEATANNLVSGDEDHTITVDGVSTDPVTVDDGDSLTDIATKWKAAVEATPGIDNFWKATVDAGALDLAYRQHGAVGNDKVISISGDVDVDVSVTTPSAGGEDAGEIPSGSATELNPNKIQIHSLNALVSKVYVLGRTTGPTTFHLIEEFEITDSGAQGQVIILPDRAEDVTEIEQDTFAPPSATDVLETVELQNYQVIGTPFQQFAISTQEDIVDQSRIIRAIPVDFDVDKSTMRYRVLIFTDKNIQLGYLSDTTITLPPGSRQRARRVFTSEFEVAFGGMKAQSREGISDVLGNIIWETKEGVYSWGRQGAPDRLFDVNRYAVSESNNLVDVIYNVPHHEMWLLYSSDEIVVYDIASGHTRRMKYSGVGSVRAGAFFGDKLYIAGGTDLIETDDAAEITDLSGGEDVSAVAETVHIGDELTQQRLLELILGGKQFNAKVEVDIQNERYEDDPGPWSDSFEADVDAGSKTLTMAGAGYQIQRTGIMPRFRISFPAVVGGLVSHVILNFVTVENRGITRK